MTDFQHLAEEARADYLARRLSLRHSMRRMAQLLDDPAEFAMLALILVTEAAERQAKAR